MGQMFRVFLLLGLISVFVSCHKDHRKVSFYYWQQSADTTDQTSVLIADLNVQKFYVHVFDVVWDASSAKALRISRTAVGPTHPMKKQQIVPVIFVTNEVIQKIDSNDISLLAKNMLSAAGTFTQSMRPDQSFSELQIDCDWTPSTKDKYFLLLQEIKKQKTDIRVGVTVRLYPYKYPERMGVPPADYGVLMCYNLGNIKDIRSENTILTFAELKQYLNASKYPLTLKPALPVFGWYVWFQGGVYKNILYLPPQLTQGVGFERAHGYVYRVLKDTILAGNYIRRGDMLRNEFPSAATLEASADLILSKLADGEEMIFYHWNESNLLYYEEIISRLAHP